MSWTRIRIWIGRHPTWTINLLTGLWMISGYLGGAMLLSAVAHMRPTPFPFQFWMFVGIFAVVWLLTAGSALFVALVLGRAGLPAANVLGGLKYVPLVGVLVGLLSVWATQVLARLYSPSADFDVEWLNVALAGAGLSIPLLLAQLAGWGLAAAVTRHKLGSGRWEVTRAARPQKSHWGWVVRHPLVSTALISTFAFFVYSLLTAWAAIVEALPSAFWWFALYVLSPIALAMLLLSLALTTSRCRRGLRTWPILVSCPVAAIAAFGWHLVGVGLGAYLARRRADWPAHLSAAGITALLVAGAMLAGWAIGELFARRRIQTGAWEVGGEERQEA